MAISRTLTRTLVLAAAALLSVAFVAACGSDDEGKSSDSITVSDQWVKAAQSGMTAAFGTIANSSDSDIRIVSAHTDVARTTEMHEVVDNGSGGTTMRQKDGGFVIPANSSITLSPGTEHFMLMDLTGPITTGQNVSFTIRFEDGSTTTFDALARDFDGNQENYAPGEAQPGHTGMTASETEPEPAGSHQ
ncbi:copper chaperone PCu(A)C [Gordonia neofelifaecis]|uniref:Copper(I)-binding protein n=1 Tax=Gordonia neofelifaecis NRRL B-59395 TaxID=644548 RepID=F1YPS9_9ACTN|nr:copper chaperone PCu(A)C [Gordonia neofelifaecis]EGD53299.1 copper(I)-binding protein [Gordonia neofelifaecis NRRL B-59395]